jgi:hypothetical protein
MFMCGAFGIHSYIILLPTSPCLFTRLFAPDNSKSYNMKLSPQLHSTKLSIPTSRVSLLNCGKKMNRRLDNRLLLRHQGADFMMNKTKFCPPF